jgi:hypothetical protein
MSAGASLEKFPCPYTFSLTPVVLLIALSATQRAGTNHSEAGCPLPQNSEGEREEAEGKSGAGSKWVAGPSPVPCPRFCVGRGLSP